MGHDVPGKVKMTLRIDVLTGCPFPNTSQEIQEALDLLGWNTAEVQNIIEYVEADEEAGTPAGWSAQITGPDQLIVSPDWFGKVAHEADLIEKALVDNHLKEQALEGKRLPPNGPIFSFGWDDERDLVIALLRLGCQQFKLSGVSANV
jgi:hypothetical protein